VKLIVQHDYAVDLVYIGARKMNLERAQ
jgi:hypothetical protein